MTAQKNINDTHAIHCDESIVTLQVQNPESMKSSRARRFTGAGIIFVASLLCGLFLSSAASLLLVAQASAQATTKAADEQAPPEKWEAWRKSMVRRPLPKNGCFKASYPSTEWQEVSCVTPPPYPFRPQTKGNKRGGPPELVGGFNGDWSAQTSGIITLAEGSFKSVNGVTSETNGTLSDSFSLQLNANFFTNATTTPLCSGAANPAFCQGWVQFVFSNNNPAPYCPACVFVQYWLTPYGGGACPPGWMSSGGDCVANSIASPVSPTLVIADLHGLTMTGQTSGGTDTATLGASSISAMRTDSTLSLDLSWNVAEFNVFGNGGGDQANFNAGSTIVVKTNVNDGSMTAPVCMNNSTTAETNNLNLVTPCCAYGGANPTIEFMETNAGHTAICGPTQLEGDPHISTADGKHYDFQGAGEFISLRGRDGAEIQTRQTPVSTTFIGTDGYDRLTTCVSLNTAVAARVGQHRVTYEPNVSGVPDPSGLQLRIDGALTTLGPQGRALGTGGRVVPLGGGALEIDFPDGKTLFVTPEWWSSQSKWYLNVDLTHLGLVSSAGGSSDRGIAGAFAEGSWLPALPNGASLGPMPASLQDRYDTLYRKFADAWRVTDKDSLFDYGQGTSTDTFTMRDWPKQNPPCVVPNTKPVEPASLDVAEAACRRVMGRDRRSDCVFDVRVTGNIGFAKTYLATQRILADSTTTSLTDDADPSRAGEWVTFTAFVAANSIEVRGFPSGSVQFAVDGSNVGEPVKVDAKGRAKWETSRLKVGTHRVTAHYIPGADTVFLPSTSLEKIHIVKRCHCDAEREEK